MVAVLVLGVVIVVATVLDVFLTVLHPTRRGPISASVTRGTFAMFRRLAIATGRRSLLNPAGPIAMAGILTVWVLLLWFGYALIYLPFMSALAYTPSVDYADHDLFEALYFSGMSLTTVGYGDIVGATDAYRLVSVLEAATGFAVLTGALTFLLSILPRVSTARVAAPTVQRQANDPVSAAEMVRGESYLISIQQQLLQLDEQTERFPILFFFHSRDQSASKYTFLRGTIMARDRLRRLVQAAGHDGDSFVLQDEKQIEQFARFAGRCEQFLEHVANQHLHEHATLVPP